MTAFEMLSAVPARERSICGALRETSTVSLTVAIGSLKSTVRSCPSATSTASCFCSLKPVNATLTVYGPTRTFSMLKRPSAPVTAS